MNTPKFHQFIGDRGVDSVQAAATYIEEKMLPQLKRLGYSNYTVSLKKDGTRLGTCGLFDREGLEGLDIGFAFLPEHENKGYGTESAYKLMDEAKIRFKIDKISGITTKTNYSSQRLLEKLGLRFSKYVKLPNDNEELMLYVWSRSKKNRNKLSL